MQETLLAALQAVGSFSGASSERTWLIGIANHKVMDHFRRSQRRSAVSLEDVDAGESSNASLRSNFTDNGKWKRGNVPGSLSDANASDPLRQKELLAFLRACLDALPPQLADVLWMRDVLQVPSEEVCQQLGLTATNMWTRAHRARESVRACMERREGQNASS